MEKDLNLLLTIQMIMNKKKKVDIKQELWIIRKRIKDLLGIMILMILGKMMKN